MSVRNTLRALPALTRIGFAEAVAYRAEMLIWVLSTTMPLVMLALWTTVAREAPVGGFGQADFVAYFLSNFIVRQLTGSWAAWEMNFEIRNGTLSMRLLRPIEPVFSYAVENLTALPMRIVVAVPVAAVMLWAVGTSHLPRDPLIWVLIVVATFSAWLTTFLLNIAIGCLSFFMESSLKVMEIYFVVFMVFSGYLVPVKLFPSVLRNVVEVLPFRFQIGFPVELMINAHGRAEALMLLGRQWLYIGVLAVLSYVLWRRGLKRFAAYGG